MLKRLIGRLNTASENASFVVITLTPHYVWRLRSLAEKASVMGEGFVSALYRESSLAVAFYRAEDLPEKAIEATSYENLTAENFGELPADVMIAAEPMKVHAHIRVYADDDYRGFNWMASQEGDSSDGLQLETIESLFSSDLAVA